MMRAFAFTLKTEDGGARLGEITTSRGTIQTPDFMPVGTAATVKAMTDRPQDREPPARELIESFGGKMHHYYFMLGEYDDNFYFNNPADYAVNLTDGWALHHLASCDIHLATGHGPWEDSGPTYR